MSTAKDPFEHLEDIPISNLTYYMPKPLHHPDNPNKIIITTDYDDAGILELDLISNELNHVHQYDRDKFAPEDHSHFIHPQSKTLFIFDGKNDCVGIFNMETKEMKYDKRNVIKTSAVGIISCFIESRNELHVIESLIKDRHRIFKLKDDGEVQIISTIGFHHCCGRDLIYIPSQHKLITLDLDEILEYNLDEASVESQWKINHKMDIEPEHEFTRSVILGFEHVMFMFHFAESENMEIWCHHLLNNKSFKSQYKVPKIMMGGVENQTFAVKDDNDYAHILDLISGKHIKVDLYKLIPMELLKSHRAYYQPLIMGYLRKQENDNNIPCIPFVLKTIILKFFAL